MGRTDPFPGSRGDIPTHLYDFSLIEISRTSAQTKSNDPTAPEGLESSLGNAQGSAVPATVGGLLALTVGVALVIAIHRNRRGNAVIQEEGESGGDISIIEAITSFEASDCYVSQENTGQVQPDELIRLSFMIE
jgi:hypothetical protein